MSAPSPPLSEAELQLVMQALQAGDPILADQAFRAATTAEAFLPEDSTLAQGAELFSLLTLASIDRRLANYNRRIRSLRARLLRVINAELGEAMKELLDKEVPAQKVWGT